MNPFIKVSYRLAPFRGIWRAVGEIFGLIASSKEPNEDVVAGPFHRVKATLVFVEASPVRFWASSCLETPWSGIRTVRSTKRAVFAGVRRHPVFFLRIDTFSNVDFSVIGPAALLSAMALFVLCRRVYVLSPVHPAVLSVLVSAVNRAA